MNIIEKIKNKLRPKIEEDKNSGSTIQFLLDNKDDAYIKIIFYDTSDSSAESFAEMLYDIMKGNYTEQSLDLLKKMSHENQEMKYFINKIFIHLSYMESQTQKKLLEPQVKPTEFLKGVKHEI